MVLGVGVGPRHARLLAGGTCCRDDGLSGQGALTELGGGWRSGGAVLRGTVAPEAEGESSCWTQEPSFQPRPRAPAPALLFPLPATSPTAQGHCAGSSFDSVAAELPGRAGVLAGAPGAGAFMTLRAAPGAGGGGQAAGPFLLRGPFFPFVGGRTQPLLVTLTVQLGPQAPSPLLVTLRQEQGREPASQAPGSQTGPTLGERGEGGRPASSSPGRKGK